MLNVRRVEEEEELHDDLIGEICDEDDEVVEIGEELILLGERIRLVNEPNLVKGTCVVGGVGVGKGGDGDGSGFNLSSLPVEGTVVSNLSSLIGKDSNLKSILYRYNYINIEKILFSYCSIDYQISSLVLPQ
jgi:hypothetical protein